MVKNSRSLLNRLKRGALLLKGLKKWEREPKKIRLEQFLIIAGAIDSNGKLGESMKEHP